VAYRLLADTLVALHVAFIAFVLAGSLAVVWRPWLAALHLPAVAWATFVEFTGTICPLTPWENAFRQRAGESGYAGGFVEHYVLPLLYPPALTPNMQALLGMVVVALNVAAYAGILRRRRPA
jgi:hypothetical protein